MDRLDPAGLLGGPTPRETDTDADQRHLQMILANVADVVLELDLDETLRWLSPSVSDVLEWVPGELVGTPLTDLVHPDDLPGLLRSRGRADSVDVRFRTARGRYRWMSTQCREVRDRGRVMGRVATLRDIDEEMTAKEALVATEARYRLLAENSNDVVLAGDNEGRITWVSDSVTEVLGWHPAELVGTGFRNVVNPNDLPQVFGAHQRLLRGQPARIRVRLRKTDDEYRWFDCLVKPVWDDEGNVIGRVGGWRDVHAEQIALDELHASQEDFRLIAENVGDVVVRTDAEQRITWASPSLPQNSGWQVEEVLGRHVWEYVHPDDQHVLRSASFDEQDGGRAEVRLRYKDGSYQHWAVFSRPATDSATIVTLRHIEAEVRARGIAVHEARQRQAMLDSMLDPHILLQAVRDESGTIVDFIYAEANDAACEFNGLPREQLVGMSLMRWMPEYAGTEVFDMYCHTVNTGEPLVLDNYRAPEEIYPEERRFDIRGVRVGDALSYTWCDVTDRARHQAQLAESEQRYRNLVEQSVDVIVSTDSAGVISFVSPAVSVLLGWQSADLIGESLNVLVYPPDRPAVADARSTLFAQGSGRYRARLKQAGGAHTWIETSASIVRGADGSVAGVSELWRDVNAEVLARQQADQESARRAAMLDSMLDPHVLMQAVRDDSGQIVDFTFAEANDAACEYNRLSREQLLGVSLIGLLPGHAGSELFDLYCRTVNSGEPLVLDDYTYPHEVFDEPRLFDIRGVRVGDAISFTWRDVTERAENQARLAISEANYRTLVERMAHVTMASDSEGAITYTSEAVTDLLGYQPDELVGVRVPDLVHPEERGVAADYWAHLMATGSARGRFRLSSKDEHYRWVEASGQAQYATDGSVTGVIALWRDATTVNASEVIAEHIGEPVLRLDGQGVITWVSPSVPRQLGGTQSGWLGSQLRDGFDPDDRPTFDQAVEQVMAGRPASGRGRLTGRDGARHWVDLTVTPTGQADTFVVSLHIVDDDVAREQTLKRIAELDTLTGLSNRRDLMMRLNAVITRRGDHTGLLFCDIDNLKQINDRAGHAAGDTVISTVAQRIQSLVRHDDICARFGGDEFVIVLLGLHHLGEAEMIAEKIRQAASTPVAVPGRASITPSLSIGVTLAREGEAVEDFIARADEAMYKAKRVGRNAVSAIE